MPDRPLGLEGQAKQLEKGPAITEETALFQRFWNLPNRWFAMSAHAPGSPERNPAQVGCGTELPGTLHSRPSPILAAKQVPQPAAPAFSPGPRGPP